MERNWGLGEAESQVAELLQNLGENQKTQFLFRTWDRLVKKFVVGCGLPEAEEWARGWAFGDWSRESAQKVHQVPGIRGSIRPYASTIRSVAFDDVVNTSYDAAATVRMAVWRSANKSTMDMTVEEHSKIAKAAADAGQAEYEAQLADLKEILSKKEDNQ